MNMKNKKSKYINYISHLNKDIVYENSPRENNIKYNYELKVVKDLDFKSSYIDFIVDEKLSEKNINITLNKMKFTRVLGKVEDCNGSIVANKLIKLYRATLFNYKTEYRFVSETITDELGKYEFVIQGDIGEVHYIIKIEDEISILT
ncbi:hypothetical protein ACQPU1_13400 [Clostridium paraputrificum]|uniref:hypothetical protein n=1 Tax=Clostridium TaxID=1485 RepID=UPI003D34A302